MKSRFFIVSLLILLFTSVSALAVDVPLGNKALGTGVVNPPGFNMIYEAEYYFGYSYGKNGKAVRLPNGKLISTQVFAHDFVAEWNTPYKLLGANYSLDIIVPFVSVDVNGGKYTEVASISGLADIYVEPLILGWNSKQLDSKFILGFNLPTGTAGLTKDHFSTSVSGAFTYFFDEGRKFQLSVMPLFEFHAKNNSNGFTEGIDFLAKYGIGYQMGMNTIGLIGYSYIKASGDSAIVTRDPGNSVIDIPTKLGPGEASVHSIGIQFNRYIESLNSVILLLVNQEYAAENASKGTRFHFVFVKLF